MDHNEAVRLQAAEKYLLGELSRAQRDEYEEHYFDCPECAEELQTTVAFMESGKRVAREGAFQSVDNKRFVIRNMGWFAWLKPAFAIPVFAALVVLVGYQNAVTIPRLKGSLSESAEIVRSSVHLLGSTRGGSDDGGPAAKLQVRRRESFIVDFDFTPSRTLSSYWWHLQDKDGHTVKNGVVPGENTNQAVRLAVLGGVDQPGTYTLVLTDSDFGNRPSRNENEVQRLTFSVEFLP